MATNGDKVTFESDCTKAMLGIKKNYAIGDPHINIFNERKREHVWNGALVRVKTRMCLSVVAGVFAKLVNSN